MDAMRTLPTVCNHLHLPAQSGSDRILSAMNRGYTRARYFSKIERLKRTVPDISFSTDLIVGFPGETDADFADSLQLLRDVDVVKRGGVQTEESKGVGVGAGCRMLVVVAGSPVFT